MTDYVTHPVELKPGMWEATGPEEDPTERLTYKAHLSLDGLMMHLEAYRVDYKDGTQEGAGPWAESAIEGICQIYEPDGPFQTIDIEIDGKTGSYLLVSFPYC